MSRVQQVPLKINGDLQLFHMDSYVVENHYSFYGEIYLIGIFLLQTLVCIDSQKANL